MYRENDHEQTGSVRVHRVTGHRKNRDILDSAVRALIMSILGVFYKKLAWWVIITQSWRFRGNAAWTVWCVNTPIGVLFQFLQPDVNQRSVFVGYNGAGCGGHENWGRGSRADGPTLHWTITTATYRSGMMAHGWGFYISQNSKRSSGRVGSRPTLRERESSAVWTQTIGQLAL